MFCNAKLDFTDALITRNTLHIDVDLRIGGNLLLVTRPGIVVDTDDLTRSSGDIKIRPASGPGTPVVLHVQLAGQSRGGDIIARPPRRKVSERPWVANTTGCSANSKVARSLQATAGQAGVVVRRKTGWCAASAANAESGLAGVTSKYAPTTSLSCLR